MRILSRAVALALALCLFGCAPKEMDLTQFAFSGDGSVTASGIVLTIDTPTDFSVSLPVENTAIAVSSSDDSLAVSLEGNTLSLEGRKSGSFTLVCTLEAKGYKSGRVEVPVLVSLHPMTLSAADIQTGTALADGAKLLLSRGTSASVLLSAEEDTVFFGASNDPKVAAASVKNGVLTVDALYPGETAIDVTAQKDGYESAKLSFRVSVEPVTAALSLSSDSISLTRGQSTSLPITFEEGGNLSVTDVPAGLSITPGQGKLSIAAEASGVYEVGVHCEADGFLPASALLRVTVSDPAATLNLPTSLSLPKGESKQLSISVTPADASITLSTSSGGISASYADGRITVEATRAGTERLTVTAAHDGYRSASATVEINVTPPVLPHPYADIEAQIIRLTNREREKAGLSPLTHIETLDAPALLRAQEAGEMWSHTRPDGSDFETVLTEYGLSYRGKGENLFAANLLDATLAVDGWMDSELHRENILRPEFTGIGVGIVDGGDGYYYYSQLFVHN